jgi:hypothetical protein
MRFLLSLVGLSFGYSASAQAHAPGNAEVIRILADWKSRQGKLTSVRYRLVGTEEEFGGPLKQGGPPPLKGSRPVQATVLIDFTNKRYRIDEDLRVPSTDRTRFIRRASTTAYDGKAYQRGIPRDIDEWTADIPDISITKGDLSLARVDSYLHPPFVAHGIVPTEELPLGPGRFPTDHELEEFQFRGGVVQNGRPCVVIASLPDSSSHPIMDEFFADAQRGGAVVRQIHWQGKNPWNRTDTEFQLTDHGWLPKSWAIVNTIGGEVRNITKMTVQTIEANPVLRDEDFTLPIKPGMRVRINDFPTKGSGLDPSIPARSVATVDEGGRLEVTSSESHRNLDGTEVVKEPSGRWIWLVGFLSLAAIVLICLWVRRRAGRTNSGGGDITPR